MILHVITACSRPERLGELGAALSAASSEGVDLRWHVAYDVERRHVGGQAIKNRLLTEIRDGWVWVCDDDNLPHPMFFRRISEIVREYPDAAGFLFAQDRGPCEDRFLRPESPPRVGRVDAAQLVARAWVATAIPIPEQYDGDGHWIAAIAATVQLRLIDEVVTLWNGGSWS